MHRLLVDGRFYAVLLRIDRDLADEVSRARCPCGGTLDVSDYPRSPRGGPAALPDGYERRFSFCCREEGCRVRATPPSVRFFGRRWYLAPVMLLVSALRHGVTMRRLEALREWLKSRGERLCRRTVERWRVWWLETFRASRTWEAGRGRFVPPVVAARLPHDLLERFAGDDQGRLTAALLFVSPVTTGSCARSLTGFERR